MVGLMLTLIFFILVICQIHINYAYSEFEDKYELATSVQNGKSTYDITWLHSAEAVNGAKNHLQIYCHCGGPKTLVSIWRSAFAEIKDTNDYKVFEGHNASDVVHQYKKHLSSWLNFVPWRHSQIVLPAFETQCFGITSVTNFGVTLVVRKINYWKVLQLVLGALLFFTAVKICRNSVFYYTSGISIGIFASLLVLLFLLSRLMPRKTAAYSVILFGGSFFIYLLQKLYANIREIIESYSIYLTAYVGIAALISFAVCYRYQPMTDRRSQDLIQWAFQLIGLLLVFFSSEFREFSMAMVIILVVSYNIPALWVAKARTWWRRRFPPKQKPLTESEYIEQTNIATKKGLEELRKFCGSPDCRSWKYVSSLRNPVRFAKFVEGDSHLTDDEILKYNSDSMSSQDELLENSDAEITDDEPADLF